MSLDRLTFCFDRRSIGFFSTFFMQILFSSLRAKLGAWVVCTKYLKEAYGFYWFLSISQDRTKSTQTYTEQLVFIT